MSLTTNGSRRNRQLVPRIGRRHDRASRRRSFDAAGRRGLARPRADALAAGRELDPDALLAAALRRRPSRRWTAAASRAIGVASMAETGVLTDDALRPVVPSIAWYDERGEEEAARLAAELPDFSARTGQPPTAMCTLAKYAWMRRNWPDAEARDALVQRRRVDRARPRRRPAPGGLAGLAHRLLRPAHGPRVGAGAWRWAGAPATLAPPHARRARRSAAHERRPVARDSTLAAHGAEGAVLAVGGHDHAAAAVGAGAAGEGDVLDSCGTAEAILRATAPLDPETVRRAVADGFTVGRHALPGRYVLQGASWSGEQLQAVIDGYGDDSTGVPRRARGGRRGRARTSSPGWRRSPARPAPRRHRRLVGRPRGPRGQAAPPRRLRARRRGLRRLPRRALEQQLPGVHDPRGVAALLDRAQQLERRASRSRRRGRARGRGRSRGGG